MLSHKRAVITGSTSGIGLGIAEALAAEGVHLLINGLGDAAEIEATRQRLATQYGVTVVYSDADMRQPGEIAHMMAQAHAALGGVDILVNNAGIQHVSPIEDFPVDKWDAIIAINLSAAFHTTRLVVPQFRAQGWGRIINLASAHALVASPFKSAYVAAKHGLAGLTKTLALELAEAGTTVNAICPGYVQTPLVEKQIPATMAARKLTRDEVIRDVLLHAQPTKRFVTVEEIGALAVFLCGTGGASMTGSIIQMDGGWTSQ